MQQSSPSIKPKSLGGNMTGMGGQYHRNIQAQLEELLGQGDQKEMTTMNSWLSISPPVKKEL